MIKSIYCVPTKKSLNTDTFYHLKVWTKLFILIDKLMMKDKKCASDSPPYVLGGRGVSFTLAKNLRMEW